MRRFSVLLLCCLSFFVGCLFTSSFMSIESSSIKEPVDQQFNPLKVRPASNKFQDDLIIVVISAPAHFGRRLIIRQTWAIDAKANDFTCLFFIGTLGLKKELVRELKTEQQEYNDLVLMPLIPENYRLLTNKVLQTFKWIHQNSEHKFVLKCDDDSFINVRQLIKSPMLKLINPLLYWGYFTGRAPIHRKGKWKEMQWNICDQYVPYARGGGYILSRSVINYIGENGHLFSTYQSEDVSVGLWLAPLNLTRHHDINFDTEYKSRGCKNSFIVTHPHSLDSLQNLHNSLRETGSLCYLEEVVRQPYEYDWNVLPSQCCQNVVKNIEANKSALTNQVRD